MIESSLTDCKLSRREWLTYAKVASPHAGKTVKIPILTDCGKKTEEGKVVAEIVVSEWKIVEIYQ